MQMAGTESGRVVERRRRGQSVAVVQRSLRTAPSAVSDTGVFIFFEFYVLPVIATDGALCAGPSPGVALPERRARTALPLRLSPAP